ncbi:MAG TPA: glycosyltransferase family 4 protein [Jatrophihabitantaceae bacterium]|nr:glycosyltransferase family 4 protein [Jatrophihabitantaceae bacterium]
MRVLMLSWEYPPLIVGGLGRHVGALSHELVAAGHEVCVVTRGGTDLPDEVPDGVRVVRAAVDPIDIDFTTESLLSWTQAFEHGLVRAALPVVRRWRPDVIHAHDWLVTQSAVTLAQVTERPIIATVHATEAGRHQGWLPAPLHRAVHSVERWLVHEAARVITCSSFMHDEVRRLFDLPSDQVEIVPNGLDADAWHAPARARLAARARYAGDGPLLVIAGRLVHEKGIQTAIAALPRLRREFPGARLVVAGTGPLEDELRAKARRLGDAVQWAGFMPESELAALLGAADAVLVPSLYEPFGLIALEAAAAGAPLAVADTGGLRDFTFAGARFAPDDPPGLAAAVVELLRDHEAARRTAARAQRRVRRDYAWATVAERTAAIYADAAGYRRERITLAGLPTATP